MTEHRTIAGRYALVDRLGAGGGGVVWRARDLDLDRMVAVKEIELPRSLSADEREQARLRAMREARAAARLEHPNVVSVYDVRSEDEALYIVMEYVDAPSLKDLVVREGPLPAERAARIGLGVLAALQAAHAAGIVHRDVKPSNILVRGQDTALVTDFGIAAVTGDTGLTLTGQALGTPDYVSPEQVTAGDVGPATDLWSLGASLYDAVEGQPPFRRTQSVATVHAVVNDLPRPAARSGPLAPLLHELLAKDPADRPTTAATRARLLDVVDRQGGADTTAAIPPVVGPTEVVDRQPTPPPAAASAPARAATTATATPPAHRVEHREPTRGRTAVRALAVVATLVLLAVLAVQLADQPDGDVAGDQPPAPTAGTTAPAAPTTAPTQTEPGTAPESAPPATEPDTPTPTTPTAPETSTTEPSPDGQAVVPEGWQVYEGPNYTVAHPPGWTPRDAGSGQIDLAAPDTDAYLRIANTDTPAEDVVADTEKIETAFAEEQDQYQRIRLEPTDYRDAEAALWEYTFTAGGQQLHGIHLNLNTGAYGYAVNYVAPEEVWQQDPDRFDHFTGSFSYPE